MAKTPTSSSRKPSALSLGPGARVLVVGLGITGLWTARWLTKQGAYVTVTDMKKESDLDPGVVRELRESEVALEFGGHTKDAFIHSDAIIISPGVPHDMPHLRSAVGEGIPVLGEIELASRFVDVPIIAVTGTNGKSTVTEFVGKMLENAGMKVFVGGNIGTPLMAFVAEQQEADYLVLEVSSFQLDTIETFCPFVSIILNITPDHLDRYTDMEAYARSKLRIYENQRPGHYLIINDDDPRLGSVSPPTGITTLRYRLNRKKETNAFLEEGIVRAGLSDNRHSFSLDHFALPGSHNQENLLAGVLAGMVLGIDNGTIQKAIDDFRGLPHRIEYVGQANSIRFYNDSKATNVDAAGRSIAGFHSPVILIAGGRHKGADYSPLVETGRGRLKGAVFLGEAKKLLAKAFEGTVAYNLVDRMEQAVDRAFSMAGPGDVVLLAPACASFDMFTDYRHRGDVFKNAVKRLVHG